MLRAAYSAPTQFIAELKRSAKLKTVLTKDTHTIINKLFTPVEVSRIEPMLLALFGARTFEVYSTPESMERIWFAVIKLCSSRLNTWDTWFELAKTDWRDLLMSAGFGEDTTAHIRWKRDILRSLNEQKNRK
jgi:hypothetical protein